MNQKQAFETLLKIRAGEDAEDQREMRERAYAAAAYIHGVLVLEGYVDYVALHEINMSDDIIPRLAALIVELELTPNGSAHPRPLGK